MDTSSPPIQHRTFTSKVNHQLWKMNPHGKNGIDLTWITWCQFDFQNRLNYAEFSTWLFSMSFGSWIDITSKRASWRNTGSDSILDLISTINRHGRQISTYLLHTLKWHYLRTLILKNIAASAAISLEFCNVANIVNKNNHILLNVKKLQFCEFGNTSFILSFYR